MKTVITLLAALLVGSGGISTLPDLCNESVFTNPASGQVITDKTGTTLSRSCVWTGPDAPAWNDTACCSIDDGETWCLPPDERGSCDAGLSPYACEYGEQSSAGGLLCYQSFPSACELGNCNDPGSAIQAPDADPQEDIICCVGGNCWPWDDLNVEDCAGLYTWCNQGYSMVDGTVECYD